MFFRPVRRDGFVAAPANMTSCHIAETFSSFHCNTARMK
jgi:hypothetical protein